MTGGAANVTTQYVLGNQPVISKTVRERAAGQSVQKLTNFDTWEDKTVLGIELGSL